MGKTRCCLALKNQSAGRKKKREKKKKQAQRNKDRDNGLEGQDRENSRRHGQVWRRQRVKRPGRWGAGMEYK